MKEVSSEHAYRGSKYDVQRLPRTQDCQLLPEGVAHLHEEGPTGRWVHVDEDGIAGMVFGMVWVRGRVVRGDGGLGKGSTGRGRDGRHRGGRRRYVGLGVLTRRHGCCGCRRGCRCRRRHCARRRGRMLLSPAACSRCSYVGRW